MFNIFSSLIFVDQMNGNKELYLACEKGNMELVQLLIEKEGANDYNNGLDGACRNGNMEIIKYLIKKGANNYNQGLCGASRNGNLEVVELMIEKGANSYDRPLYLACQSQSEKNIEIVRLLMEKGAVGIEGCYLFPENENIIRKLLSRSLSLKLFEKINGYNLLVSLIKEREDHIIFIMNGYINSNINNYLLKDYILNEF